LEEPELKHMKSILTYLKTLPIVLAAAFGFSMNAYTQIQIGQDIDGEAVGDWSGYLVSMPDANTIAIGAANNDGSGTDAGHVRIYTWNGSIWVQKGMDIDGEAATDNSGRSVSMPDANTIAIGAYANDGYGTDAGHTRVYTWNGTAWVQKGIDLDGESTGDNSGFAVDMPDANTIAISAHLNDGTATSAGHVRIYSWNGSAWIQKGVDINGEALGDKSGISISMPDANTVAIGAGYNSDSGFEAGHVRIYQWDGSVWTQKGIDIDGEASGDMSGWSVCMPDLHTVAIGAFYNDSNGSDAGHVRIYEWNGSAWIQKGLDIDGEAASDQSGLVSMPDANTVAIGAINNDGNGANAGHVRIYGWNGSAWQQIGVDINGEAVNDYSGLLSMPDANTIAVGAYRNDGNGTDAGHVRVYKLKGVQGLVYNDINQNCIHDELGFVSGIVGIIEPGSIVVQTNSNGIWQLDSLPVGAYTITFDTTGNWLATCPNPMNFTITDPTTITMVTNFGMVNNNPCSEPNVSIHMPTIRPGFSNQMIYVSVCNAITGTGTLNSDSVIVVLDDLITVDAASISYTDLGNNTFSFDLGTIDPGECVNFNISTTLSNSAILGQTLCMEALLAPIDSCALDTIPASPPSDFIPCSLPCDNSSLSVEGECVNDSIVFTVTNTGTPGSGDMDCFSPVRLYIDGVYIWLDSLQLNGGESFVYNFAGDGQTWRLEVDQHPLHPGNSNPNATIELCGNPANWTPDLVNLFPHDDFDPINDIYCGQVTGSYDPNDKTGFPLGIGTDHLVAANGKMDYVIRFQNTGTDTAFTVVIRDTLDLDLDIFSVQSGVASHAYTFQMYGPRVLEWTFNNILLPDSNVNEPASNGFVTFTVNQAPNLADGAEINNTANIYFDFNPPIITNTTSHKIGSEIGIASWTEEYDTSLTSCNEYVYNGLTYTESGNYYQVIEGLSTDTLVTLHININNPSTGIDIQTACESYLWIDGNTYTISNNTATHTLINSSGCDSVVTLDLLINNPSADTDIQTACGSYVWIDGNTYTTSNNTATHTLTNMAGCDSVVTLNLTINNVSDLTTTLSDITVTANNANASYVWVDCDNNFAPISGEMGQSFMPAENGNYAVVLSENGCVDTSDCIAVTTVGIIENTLTENFVIYPNPTNGQVNIVFENIQEELNVSLHSVSGQLLETQTFKNSSTVTFEIEGAAGVYFLKLNCNDQEATIRVVKE
jgi:hypothetical protein